MSIGPRRCRGCSPRCTLQWDSRWSARSSGGCWYGGRWPRRLGPSGLAHAGCCGHVWPQWAGRPKNREEAAMKSMRLALGALAFGLLASHPAHAQAIEKPDVTLAVGGKSGLYYLPLSITERLGYFKQHGLDVTINDFAGGAKSLQALLGGSVEVVTGAYEHTVRMQA